MNYPRKSTVTFRFKVSAISAFVLLLSGCSSTLSSNSGVCASDDDCLGAQSCVENRCAMACFTAQDCASNETCEFNRCRAAPEVYADVGMAATDTAPVSSSDGAVDEIDSTLVDMNMTELDQSVGDMVVNEDMSSVDMNLQEDANSRSDSDVSLEQIDAAMQDAAIQDAATQDAAAQDAGL